MAEDERSEGELTTPIFSAKFKGLDIQLRDILLLISVALAPTVAYMLWEHKEDGKSVQREFVTAVRELAAGQKEQNRISREQVCLLRFGQDQRERATEYCRQVAQ